MNRFAFENESLLNPDISSSLGAGYNVGIGTFALASVQGFSEDGFIVIEELGNPNWEILKIQSISGKNVTTTTNSVNPHAFGTKVYYVRFNKTRLYRSSTKTSTGTLVETLDIQGWNITNKGEKITVLEDDTHVSGFAFMVLYDSVGSVEDTVFSAPIPYRLETNTLQYVKDSAFRALRKQPDTVLNDDLIFDLANHCTQDIRDTRRKFSDLNDLEDSLGNTVAGKWNYDLPTDIHSKLTNNSIYGLRIKGRQELEYLDKMEWNDITTGFIYSTLANQITTATVDIEVSNGSLFEGRNVAFIGNDSIKYESVDGNLLKNVEGITTTHQSGQWVFSNGVRWGNPNYYTIIDGEIYLYPVPRNMVSGQEIMIDYDKDINAIETMADELPFPAMLYIHYIKAGMLEAENSGEPTSGSNRERQFYESRLQRFFDIDPRSKRTFLRPSLYSRNRRSRRIRH